ncbi:MAG: biotin--[acetyl-CoA-carboxylase] ligase [Crocinitomicaceae bacterium]|nr:biotin--[acetyl-CoA-carboxylase] ligase [Crocinitomicaceae bacterium]|tara:strand:- start:1373 stop:2119 length:747 start_codon:yes stop_codon:yes gene_type:complete
MSNKADLGEFIHLNSVDSTNRFLRELSKSRQLNNWTAVYADYQTNGKGQRGNTWRSVSGKNLLCSVYYRPISLNANQAFFINEWVSFSVAHMLESFGIKDVLIKWPNDILIGRKKVCGILVENTVAGGRISETIIGIGINANDFPKDLNSTSLKNELGDSIEVKDILKNLVNQLSNDSLIFEKRKQVLSELYLKKLYGYKNLVPLRDADSEWNGRVINIQPSGKIQIEKNGEILDFDFKEIEWQGLTS